MKRFEKGKQRKLPRGGGGKITRGGKKIPYGWRLISKKKERKRNAVPVTQGDEGADIFGRQRERGNEGGR